MHATPPLLPQTALRALWLHSTAEEVDAAVAAVAPLIERRCMRVCLVKGGGCAAAYCARPPSCSVDLRALAADAAELFPPDPCGLVPTDVVRAFMDARRTKGLA